MQLNNSINNAKPSFSARLYLQNINKKDLEFFKGIAQDFHKATKDLKGSSFTLIENADEFVVRSNKDINNFGSIYKQDINNVSRDVILKSFTTIAETLRTVENFADKSKPFKAAKKKEVKFKLDGEISKFEEFTNYLKKLL